MKISDQIIMCLQNLFRRKVRTALTVFGVIIGTCAIVVMVSLGVGMQASQDAMLAEMGDLTMIEINNYSGYNENGEKLIINDEVLHKIQQMDHVDVFTPFYEPNSWNSFTLYGGNGKRYRSRMYTVVGVYPEAMEKMGFKLNKGSFLSDSQGDTIEILFGYYAPYDFEDTRKKRNNTVQYWNTKEDGSMPDPFIDVMKESKLVLQINNTKENGKTIDLKVKGTGITEFDSQNYQTGYGVFISVKQLKMLEEKYNKLNNIKVSEDEKANYTTAKVKVTDMKYVEEVQAAIDEMGFNTYSMENIRKPMQEQARKQQMTLGGLGAISLFVAALSITNTMVMSIYERTKEIGVMKVLGCMVGNIRSVFLMEAGVIGFMGGVIGIIISYIISYIINIVGNGLTGGLSGGISGGFGMVVSSGYYGGGGGMAQTSIIPWWLALGALVFATLIGLISGYSPANRAVKISALEAIKNE